MVVAQAQREPTSWTRPLRYVVSAYFGVAALQWTLIWAWNAFATEAFWLRRIGRAGHPVPGDFVLNVLILPIAVTTLWTLLVVTFMLVLALGSLNAWRWAFWATLAWLALASVGIVTNALQLLAIVRLGVGRFIFAAAFDGFNLFWGLVGLALAIWCVIAAVRYGPWGMVKPGRVTREVQPISSSA